MADDRDVYVTRQGSFSVLRDAKTNAIVRRAPEVAPSSLPVKYRKHFREALRDISNNGEMWYQRLHNIAMGIPFTPVDPETGRQSEPMVPSMDVQMNALVALMHMVEGKPVAQTEVKYAERDEAIRAALQAQSDEQLEKIIEGEYTKND